MNYIAKQHLNHAQFGYMVTAPESGRCLGGFGANYYRPWVFPLYTPSGLTVLQEFAFDHPFHNGFWVAQGPLKFGGEEVHFWPAPPMRKANEALFANMGRMEVGTPQIDELENGVRFTLEVTWLDKHEEPVLDEKRTVHFIEHAEGTVCNMQSTKQATYGAIEYQQSKFGSIGIRVEPQLLPDFGGVVLANGGRRGTADIAIDQECSYVAYENGLANGNRLGVMMTILDPTSDQAGTKTGPWFVRDYGMAMYNANRNHSIHSAKGESWSVGLRVIAYDGEMTDDRASKLMNP